MLETEIREKINEIEAFLDKNWKDQEDLSLYTGVGAIPVFYFMMYKLTNDKAYIEKSRDSVEALFERINEEEFGPTYCYGMAGWAYVFEYLKRHEVLHPEEIEETLVDIDQTIAELAETNLHTIKDTDLLHGALGAAHYLLYRYPSNPSLKAPLLAIVEKFVVIFTDDIEKAKKVQDIVAYDDETHRINCGMAHGHVSSLIVLSKFLTLFPGHEGVENLLNKLAHFLLSFTTPDDSTPSTFPSIAINRKTATYNIALGWCYGDQTASLGLYRAGVATNNEQIIEEAFRIAKRTQRRDDYIKALFTENCDAGFCHGLTSLAYLNKKWFGFSEDATFERLYEKFMSDVVKKGSGDQGFAGYRKYMGEGVFEDAIGLLDGVIGIGIVLIDYLIDDNVEWDGLFILD